jgi:hypothetical protein
MASPIHADTVAFCRKCGKPLTVETRREWKGIPYCEPCSDLVQAAEAVPAAEEAPPETAAPARESRPASGTFSRPSSSSRYVRPSDPAGSSVSPVLAGILGFIPGVGAVYNGQFAKGILHVMIFGLLVSIIAADGTGDLRPMFVFLLILMGIYMPIEAYRTARSIERGEPVEEFSGILLVFGSKKPSPAGGVVLIVLGVVLLLNTLGYWRLGDLVRFWPLLLVALGAYMLYRSVSEQARQDRMADFSSPLRGMDAERPRPMGSEPGHAEPHAGEEGG